MNENELLKKAEEAIHVMAETAGRLDVSGAVESALAACHEDRGYCKSPIDERKSTVQFMLQDVKDNSFNKSGDGKEDCE